MKSSFQYTLGADPEMFVRSVRTGLLVPVCYRVGGTKEQPLPFRNSVGNELQGYKYQEDNVAFEVNVPPSTSARMFIDSINRVLTHSTTLLESKGLRPDITRTAHRFAASDLANDKAQTIGCDPDMCAYGGADDKPVAREPFDIKDLGTWRHVGGHIHFGYDKELPIPPHVVVQLIDACVYLPILSKDKQKARRTKYGLAGLYRPKPYGVEYRTMSNFWLREPTLVAQRCFNLLKDMHNNIELLHEFYIKLPLEDIKACIDNGTVADSAALWKALTKRPHFSDLFISNNHPPSEASEWSPSAAYQA